MKHNQVKFYQVCLNYIPGARNSPTPDVKCFTKAYIGKYEKNLLVWNRDGVLILALVLVLTRVLFSVLSCTLYLAKFMSARTRTYLSTVTKKTVLMSTLRVPPSTFFKFQSDRKTKVNCFSGPPSSVSNAPHLSFFKLAKSGLN